MDTDEAIIKIYSYVKDLIGFQLIQTICVCAIAIVVIIWAVETGNSWHRGE